MKVGGATWRFLIAALTLATVAGCGSDRPSYFIPSCANYPTLQPGYHVDVQKPALTLGRGDFVIYHSPVTNTPDATAVSRIVGMPGETIRASDGRIFVNGRVLSESYLPNGTRTANFGPVTIPAGFYFLIGDNRADSADSRAFGSISTSQIVAKVTHIRKGPAPADGPQPADCKAVSESGQPAQAS